MCFYVGRRKKQVWFWYLYHKRSKSILKWHIGSRADKDLRELLSGINIENVGVFCTDDWNSYSRILSPEKHKIGKKYTQQIERQNSNFRKDLKRLNRETVNFSRSKKVLEVLISEYIKKHYFKPITHKQKNPSL